MKRCPGCGETSHSEFYANKSRVDGLSHYCKTCSKARAKQSREKNRPLYLARRRAHYAQNRDKQRAQKLERAYGLDVATYDRLFELQNGVCAICHLGEKQALAVDHDHRTGYVRALLCKACNLLIGNARESTTVLRAAIRYLDWHLASKVA